MIEGKPLEGNVLELFFYSTISLINSNSEQIPDKWRGIPRHALQVSRILYVRALLL